VADITSPDIQKFSTLVKLQPDNPEAHFGLGLAFEEANDTGESVKAYEKALKINPKHSRSYLHRGFHYAKGGELDHALQDWSRAFEYDALLALKFSRDPDTQMRYQQKIDSALQQFQRPIVVNPKNSFAHYQLGSAQKYFNRLELAIQSLKSALDLNPKLWEAYHQCGDIYARLEQNKLAISNFKRAIDANPKYADTQFQLALIYEKENMSGLAVKHLEEAIRLDPEAGRFYFAYGRVYMRQTKFKNAMQQFQRALDKDPNNPDIHLHLAECCKEMYRPDLALHCYEKAVELDPNSFKAVSELGSIALQMGEVDKAIGSFNRAIELNPADPYVHYNLAQTYQRKGDNRNSEKHFTQSFDLNPKDAFAAYNLGLVREELGNLQGAVDAYKKAVELKSQDLQYQLRLAKACLAVNNQSDAITALRAANRQNPNDLETNFLLADVMMKSGQLDEAIAMYRKVTELNPESVDAHFRLADAFTRLEMFDYAFESYQQALRLNSKHVESLEGMGRLYLRQRNKPTIAVDFFQQALEIDPTNTQAIASLGEAYVALNQPDRALQFFERKLEENREKPDFLAKYSEALALSGQSLKAITELRRALQLDPENILIRKTLGRLYFQEKKFTDSLEQWQELANQDPGNAEHKYQVGRCYEELGDTQKAMVAYNDVLVLRADHKEAMQRLEVLYGESPEGFVAVPTRKPEESIQPVAAVPLPADTSFDNLESLLNVEEQPPAPVAVAEVVAAPQLPPVMSVPEEELSADDLLASLMGGSTDSGSSAPPPVVGFPEIPAVAIQVEPPVEVPVAVEVPVPVVAPAVVEPPAPAAASWEDELASVSPAVPEPVNVVPEAAADPLASLWGDAEPEAVAAAPVAPVSPPAAAEDDDLGDFLKTLGYEAEDQPAATTPAAVEPTVEAPPVTAAEVVAEEATPPVAVVATPVEEAAAVEVAPSTVEPETPPVPEATSPAEVVPTPVVEEPAPVEVAPTPVVEQPAAVEAAPTPQPAAAADTSADIQALRQKAILAQVMGKVDEAEACHQQILQANPMDYQTYLIYGQFARNVRGDSAKAMALFSGGLQIASMSGDQTSVKQFEQELALMRSGEVPAVAEAPAAPEPPAVEEVVAIAESTQVVEETQAPVQEAAEVETVTPEPVEVVEAQPEVPITPMESIQALVAAGTLDQAKSEALELWNQDSSQTEVLDLLLSLENVSDPERSAWLETAAPISSKYWMPLFLSYEAQGQPDQLSSTYSKWKLVEDGPASQEFERAMFSLATQQETTKNYQAALDILRSYKLATDGGDDRAWASLQRWTETLEEAEDFSGAISIYDQQCKGEFAGLAARAGEEKLRILGAWAESAEHKGDIAASISINRNILELNPEQDAARSEIARLGALQADTLLGTGDYETAIGLLEESQDQAKLVEAYLAWGQALAGDKLFEQASGVLAKGLRSSGHDSIREELKRVNFAWASQFESEGDFEQAIETLQSFAKNHEQLEAVEASVISYYKDWARLLREEGHTEAAQDVETRFATEYPHLQPEKPSESQVLTSEIQSLLEKKDWKNSEELVKRLLVLEPENGEASGYLQSAREGLWNEALIGARFEEAESYLDSLKAEKLPLTYSAWSKSLAAAGEFEQALNIANKWKSTGVEEDSASGCIAALQLEWADGLLEANMPNEASQMYQAIADLQYEFTGKAEAVSRAVVGLGRTTIALAVAAEAAGNLEGALAQFKAVLASEPTSEAALEAVARLEAALAPPEPEQPPVQEAEVALATPEQSTEVAVEAEVAQETQEVADAPTETAAVAAPAADTVEAVQPAETVVEPAEAVSEPAAPAAEQVIEIDLSKSAEVPSVAAEVLAARDELAAGNMEQGEAALRAYLLANPGDSAAHDVVFGALLNVNSGKRLVEFYRDLQKSCPNESEMLRYLARAYCDTGKDTLAVVQYRKLTQIKPSADSYAELSEAYLRLKKYSEVLKYVENGLELQAGHARCLVCKVKATFHENSEAVPELCQQILISEAEQPAKDWVTKVIAAGYSVDAAEA
jgi:tetratricopeptide (TPR) repeat protein